jgi:membrane-associated PAP2 superfamily phosphatase
MNRTGLAIALAVAAIVGVGFAVDPRLDLDIAALFFDPQSQIFAVNAQLWVQHTRDAARVLIAVLAAPAFLAILGKLIMPQRRMLIEGRAAVLLVVTLALGPGLIANVIFKDHWGRARPIDVKEFGGTKRFTPWWDPRGECPNNCSFIAGEPSGAFWTMAPAALAPPQWRLAAYGAALAFGAGIGVLRMGSGAHFFTDVVFAGVFMYLVVWAVHGLIYRWRATRTTEEAIKRPLARVGVALRDALAALAQRVGWGAGKGV